MKDLIEKIYVINLARRPDRKALMIKRLTHHNLIQKTTFIDAIDSKSSPLIDWYLFNVPPKDKTGDNALQRAEIACFLSHIKALRQIYLDGCQRAIIMEDDVMLHNQFNEKYQELEASIPKDIPLLMLCHFIGNRAGIVEFHDRSDLAIPGPYCYRMQCYQVTRDYAFAALRAYDRPFGYIKDQLTLFTAEVITIQWRNLTKKPALMVKVPLVIEDFKSTDIGIGGCMKAHHYYFSQFGVENYNSAE